MIVFFALLFYVATAILVVGLAYKIVDYARTPAPLKIPTTPAPTTTGGVALRMFREVVFFESLFKANLWIWVFGWLFHAALLLVLLRHLRYSPSRCGTGSPSSSPSACTPASPWWPAWPGCGRAVSWSTASATSRRLPIT